jgi:hypothetical protein
MNHPTKDFLHLSPRYFLCLSKKTDAIGISGGLIMAELRTLAKKQMGKTPNN